MDPLLKAVCTIIGTSTVFVTAVFALIKYVNSQVRQAIAAHEEVIMNREEACSVNKGGQIDRLVEAINKHVQGNVENEQLINRRLNDVDLWRKEINGQIKRYGLQLEFQNKIAMEQKDVIKEIAHTTTQTSIKLAVIMQHLNISINQ